MSIKIGNNRIQFKRFHFRIELNSIFQTKIFITNKENECSKKYSAPN